jgi:GxxExxY protein
MLLFWYLCASYVSPMILCGKKTAMKATRKYLDELTYEIIGCAIEVHKQLGPGLLESVYERCFLKELALKRIEYKNQMRVPIQYKGLLLDADLRFDVMVEEILLIELKAIDGLLPVMRQSC